jgi:lysozyme family protein
VTAVNFKPSLNFVWLPGYDNPLDGYHVTPGDSGGGTKGGVIQATWDHAVRQGIVAGSLVHATNGQLSLVLKHYFWSTACDGLPDGVDFLLFNGRMMSGRYPIIFQETLGFTGDDLDGQIGPVTIASAKARDPRQLIDALCAAHLAYCQSLSGWSEFRGGWTKRLVAAHLLATSMISKGI